MRFKGQYRIQLPEKEIILPNVVCSAGQESFLKMMLRGTTTDVAVGGNFYIGICGIAASEADTLANVVGEPDGTGGYARQAVSRDATGWPTISTVNGIWRGLSKSITFAASGGDYSLPWYRLFMCNASSGTTGILYSYSATLITPITVTDGVSYPAAYELYVDS